MFFQRHRHLDKVSKSRHQESKPIYRHIEQVPNRIMACFFVGAILTWALSSQSQCKSCVTGIGILVEVSVSRWKDDAKKCWISLLIHFHSSSSSSLKHQQHQATATWTPRRRMCKLIYYLSLFFKSDFLCACAMMTMNINNWLKNRERSSVFINAPRSRNRGIKKLKRIN